MATDQPPSRWLLTLSGGYPDGIWCCSACMAPLTEGVITHEGGCPDSAPAIRAAERERIRELADSLGAGYEERQPCSCGGKLCRGILIRAHAPFADLIEEET